MKAVLHFAYAYPAGTRVYQAYGSSRITISTSVHWLSLLLHKLPFDFAKAFGIGVRHPIFTAFILLAASCGVAALSWNLLETPLLKLTKSFDFTSSPINRADTPFVATGLRMQSLRDLAKKSDIAVRINLYRRFWQIRQRYLLANGYFNSFPADSAGEAIPWYSYPAVTFLKNVLQREWKVFEYGCGYSTIFWNKNCARTVSVEHDERWFNHIKNTYPEFELHLTKEGTAVHRKEATALITAFNERHFNLPLSSSREHNNTHGLLNSEFANYAAKLTDYPKGFFDVIVVDGMARSLCLFLAAEYISERGMIVLDNSDRWQYNDLQHYLIHERSFKRIDFHGLGPRNACGWTTSVFFRDPDFLLKSRSRRDAGSGDLGW